MCSEVPNNLFAPYGCTVSHCLFIVDKRNSKATSRLMIKFDITTFNPDILPFLGAALASFFWIVDAVIDVYLFNEDELIHESLLTPEPVELWMRCLVVTMFVLFGLYAKKILLAQQNITSELSLYKKQLESRADELAKTNSLLQIYIKEKEKIEKELEYLAEVDPLTALINRRKFDELLDTKKQNSQ